MLADERVITLEEVDFLLEALDGEEPQETPEATIRKRAGHKPRGPDQKKRRVRQDSFDYEYKPRVVREDAEAASKAKYYCENRQKKRMAKRFKDMQQDLQNPMQTPDDDGLDSQLLSQAHPDLAG